MLQSKSDFAFLLKLVIIILIMWTIVVAVSLKVNIGNERKRTIGLASKEALTIFNKDQAFRQWASRHGGVYVPPDDRTPPNPHLSHIPDRDIVTSSGKSLTLMNPAYMLRQMMDEFSESYGIKGRATSLKYLNPKNKPDEWETKALIAFQGSVKEVFEVSTINGEPYLRLMRPMIINESCLKCHGYQGYKIGDVRGGVGVSVPMKPYLQLEKKLLKDIVLTHTGFWLSGLIGIFYIFHIGRKRLIEQNHAQESLRISEEKFSSITAVLGEGVFMLDKQGCVVFMNPESERLLGWRETELLGKRMHDIIHRCKPDGASLPHELCQIEKVLDTGNMYRSDEDNAFIKKDGTVFPISYVSTPVIRDGEVTGSVTAFQDITLRKRMEEEIKTMNIHLQRSVDQQEIINAALFISLSPDSYEKKLQNILNIILIHSQISSQHKGCIFICDNKTQTLRLASSFNVDDEHLSACCHVPYGKCLCGQCASTRQIVFTSKCNEDLCPVSSKEQAAHGDYCIPISSAAELLGVIHIYTAEGYERNDDDEQFVTSMANILTGVIVRNKEMQLIEMDRAASVTTLSAGIAHEINNPLSFIKTSINTLNKYLAKIEPFVRHAQLSPSLESLSEEQVEALRQDKILDMIAMMNNKIRSSNRGIERIMEVVNALKQFAQLNKAEVTDVDLNKSIDETLSAIFTEDTNVQVVREYGQLPMYACEPLAINQCFYHIIDNAIGAVSAASSGIITITTSYMPQTDKAQGGIIQIRIDDNGTGMSVEEVKYAFVPFYTTKEVGSGKGLGLSIVNGIVKRHGGEVQIQSTKGKGTSVMLRLPVNRE